MTLRLLLALSLLLPAGLQAGGDGFGVSVMAGYRDGGRFDDPQGDRRRSVDGSAAFAVAVNLPHSPGRQYEFIYSRQDSGLEQSSIDLEVQYIHFGGRVHFRGEQVRPYLAGGIGATHLRARGVESGTDTRASMSLALGLEFPVDSQWAARLEVRGHGTLTGGQRDLLCLAGGDAGLECRVRYEGDTLVQMEALAGVTYRF